MNHGRFALQADRRAVGRVNGQGRTSHGDPPGVRWHERGRPSRGDRPDATVGSRVVAALVPVSAHGGDPEPLVYLGIGFLAGLAAIYYGAKQWRVGKLLENTATERIRSAAVGRTEVDGACRDVGLTYEQPYTDGECVYRHWTVEERRRSSDPDDATQEWVTVEDGTDVAPFFVQDDTGRLLVDTTQQPHFEISPANSYSTTVRAGMEPAPEVQSFSPGDEQPDGAVLGGVERTERDDRTDHTDRDASDRERFLEEHVDDTVLTEDGRLREEVTAAQLQQAVDDDAGEFDVSDLFVGMTGGGAREGSSLSGGGSSGGTDAEPEGEDGQHRAEAIVEELGGVGDAGDMGTGSSVARTLVATALGRATGGRLGAGTGDSIGFIGGSGRPSTSNRRRYSHEVLPVGEEVYVFGAAEARTGGAGANEDRLKLGAEPATGQFIVSDRDERSIEEHYTHRGPLYVLGGLVASTACLAGGLWLLGIG